MLEENRHVQKALQGYGEDPGDVGGVGQGAGWGKRLLICSQRSNSEVSKAEKSSLWRMSQRRLQSRVDPNVMRVSA